MSFPNLRADARRYTEFGGWRSSPGFWIVAIYRFGMWAAALPFPLRLPLWAIYRVMHLPYWLFNVQLWAGRRGAKIGPGLLLIHPNNIYFPPGVVIGENCTIYHEVTMGMGHIPGTPRIGSNTTLFAGARVLGGLTIGDNVMIGANCVVLRDVAAGTIVMPPANRNLPRSLSPQGRQQDSVVDSDSTG